VSRLNAAATLDANSKAMLYEGANLSQLAVIFRIAHPVLVEKIQGVPPAGERSGVAIYHIRDVAQRLARPEAHEITAAVMRMHPSELPKMLTKEYWAGQRSRQDYELKAGELWPTAKVVSEVGELLKLVKMSAQLTGDAVERQVELSDRQRAIIKGLMDGMLQDLHKSVVEKFSKKEVIDDEPL
jgi:hypothetical protein